MIRGVLVAMISGVLGLGLTVGARLAQRPVNAEVTPTEAPTQRIRRVRTRMVRSECPGGLTGFEDQRNEIAAETRRLQAERAGLAYRANDLGSAWPDALNDGFRPEEVRPELEAMLPDDAEVEWSCDTVPCTAMIVLPGEAYEDASELRNAIESSFPGASSEVVPVDAEAYPDREGEAFGQAIWVQPMPELEDEAHQARAYYQQRQPRKAVHEAMRQRWLQSGD